MLTSQTVAVSFVIGFQVRGGELKAVSFVIGFQVKGYFARLSSLERIIEDSSIFPVYNPNVNITNVSCRSHPSTDKIEIKIAIMTRSYTIL